ncbi:hypothetical protein PENTCL1PPCAC_5702, partial [Pristionchus entomophagus]
GEWRARSRRHKDITSLKYKAMEYAIQFYRRGEELDVRNVSIFCPPFFISSTAFGFYIENNFAVDANTVVVVDLISGSCYLQDIVPAPSFPQLASHRNQFQCEERQKGNRDPPLR